MKKGHEITWQDRKNSDRVSQSIALEARPRSLASRPSTLIQEVEYPKQYSNPSTPKNRVFTVIDLTVYASPLDFRGASLASWSPPPRTGALGRRLLLSLPLRRGTDRPAVD
ncbi:hypothetical protein DPMN_007091 [Dreissena polymorpha]|uniref:Uncharacterized protein n=1 Tax=Dreissena polymorpha TaxID=45954 RepID=A0A9D4RVM9_DREPO|nr:hypothetical protein DPMN_007091 [Dreissena polymorpha]